MFSHVLDFYEPSKIIGSGVSSQVTLIVRVLGLHDKGFDDEQRVRFEMHSQILFVGGEGQGH